MPPCGVPSSVGEHLFAEDIAAFQPFSEYCLVHRDVGKQPFMADMVEALSLCHPPESIRENSSF